jgi:hypothetical protein
MPDFQNRSMKCSRGDGRARFKFWCCVGTAILGQAYRPAQDLKIRSRAGEQEQEQ